MTRIPFEENLKEAYKPIFTNLNNYIDRKKETEDVSK